MSNSEPEERFKGIEKRLKGLEDKPKDRWDKFGIIATLFIPASIALAGYFFSDSLKKAEIASNEQKATQELNIARVNSRVGQAQLVSNFIESLISNNPQKQRLAIKAILIALPDDGPELVKIVSESASDANIQQYATDALDKRRSQLVKDIFGLDKDVRVAASIELIRGWHSDAKVVPLVLETANQNRDNQDGIANALVVLNSIDIDLLLKNQEKVNAFLSAINPAGPRIKGLIDQLRSRLSPGAAVQR